MAQNLVQANRPFGVRLEGSNLAVSVPAAGNTELLLLNVEELDRIFVQIENDGANPFDAFTVNAKSQSGAQFDALFSSAAHFTAPQGLLVGASGDLTTLAAGQRGWLMLDVKGLYQVQITASAGVGTTTVDLFVCGNSD